MITYVDGKKVDKMLKLESKTDKRTAIVTRTVCGHDCVYELHWAGSFTYSLKSYVSRKAFESGCPEEYRIWFEINTIHGLDRYTVDIFGKDKDGRMYSADRYIKPHEWEAQQFADAIIAGGFVPYYGRRAFDKSDELECPALSHVLWRIHRLCERRFTWSNTESGEYAGLMASATSVSRELFKDLVNEKGGEIMVEDTDEKCAIYHDYTVWA